MYDLLLSDQRQSWGLLKQESTLTQTENLKNEIKYGYKNIINLKDISFSFKQQQHLSPQNKGYSQEEIIGRQSQSKL